MSSLTSGQVFTGAKWNYQIVNALTGDGTHSSTVFKAKVLQKDGVLDAPQWFATLHQAGESLKRECEIYRLPSIASGACSRKMYDVIANPMNIGNSDDGSIPYVAFEWLETTLQDVKYQPSMHIYAIIRTVAKTALTSCAILADRQLVNTGRTPDLKKGWHSLISLDYKPANFLLSGIETDDITAKVGDLGHNE
ncbi:hypothetical protein EMCG_04315 [[Emmonsia] crescens]|uniref:Protein kinase domain-containing protein n=1 Tax=[Emmonsia] crescens TaxID=73230 RepID=A0A0G2J7M3_9EURO|nr:hypothetical protein EMCG_04315 [Emmonsia crescens UAMH 3008]